MDVTFSAEQDLLRTSVRDFLAQSVPVSRVRAWLEAPADHADAVWKQIAELGWTGLVVPEAWGGAGLGPVELALVLEEMGRALLPGAYFSTVVLFGGLIELGGDRAQQQTWLPAIAEGSVRGSLALLEDSGLWTPEGITLAAQPRDGGVALHGRKLLVWDAEDCDVFAVAARGPEGVELWLVPAATPGVTIRPVPHTDPTRSVAEVTFEHVGVARAARLGAPGEGATLLEALLDRGRMALAARLSGSAGAALDLALAHARSREQFGRPIGSFQAIQHRCADMLVQLESARSATYYAAWCLAEEDPEAHVAACMAKAYASDAAPAVTQACIQIHGGLGYTWDQDPQLHYKRAVADALWLGDASWHRERIAQALFDSA